MLHLIHNQSRTPNSNYFILSSSNHILSPHFTLSSSLSKPPKKLIKKIPRKSSRKKALKKEAMASLSSLSSLTLSNSLTSKPNSFKSSSKPKLTISCSSNTEDNHIKNFSTALALSSLLLSSTTLAPPPASADIAGLTPCKESKQFAKREKQSLKKLESSLKLYAPDSAPALAIKATMEKTKKRFENYGKFGLLCGSDGLPHLIVSGDQRHWGEFITPGVLFLYIAGWIGWVGRSYLIAIKGEKKPTQKEIIIDVPLASRLLFRGFIWPVAAFREFVNGDLVVPDKDVSIWG